MKILSMGVRNFLTIGEAHINLNDKGLVLVQGINDDDSSANSNGAGKSSVTEALSWALYGKTARGEGGDSVVNKTAKKDCRVELDLLDGENTIRIVRHRKHKEHKNSTLVYLVSEAGELAPLHKGTEVETQSIITEIIGCSYDVFCSAVYAGQESMPNIPAMTDKQLKGLVEEAAGITRLERAHDVAKEKRLTKERDVTRLEGQLAVTNASISRAKTIELEQVIGDIDAWNARQRDLVAQERRGHDAERAAAVEAATALKAMPVAEIEAELVKIDADLASITEKRRAADRAAAQVASAQSAHATYRARVESLIADVKHIDTEVAALDKGMPCPTCGTASSPETIDQTRENLQQRRAARLGAALEAKTAVDNAKAEVSRAELARDEASALVPDATALSARAAALRAEKAKADGLRSKAASHLDRSKQHSARADALEKEPNPHIATRDRLVRRTEELEAVYETQAAELAKAREEYEVADAVVKVFSPAGVRAHILDTVTPLLNERTADYLSTLSDGNISAVWSTLSTTAKGELREKFVIDVENTKGAESFGGLSGGEKRKVRLACMLALQDLVSARATKPIDLWIGDEIDDAMDSSGQERLMAILDKKARERGTVLVISHNDLKDWIDQVMLVRKSGGYSTVEGALTAA